MTDPKRILVADDDIDFVKILEGRLKQRGYQVAVAQSGEQAINLVRVFHPDLILLDLDMADLPGDVAGLRIRCENRERQIPIVALTGHGDFMSQATTYAMGFADHILKPYEPEDLFRRIEKLLAGLTAPENEKKAP